MALNADEKKLLAELQARINEPDEDNDFEIEVYDTEKGKGARIPYGTGKSWLYDVFGIGDAPAPAGDEGGAGTEVAPGSGTADKGAKKDKGYFGRQA